MAKIQQFSELTPNIPFTEYNFYDLYRQSFESSELGRIKRLLPLDRMAENLGLYCDIVINPMSPLTNYKLFDDIVGEMSAGLKIQQLQVLLAEARKPYMTNLGTMYTDATCYESQMQGMRIATTASSMISRPLS